MAVAHVGLNAHLVSVAHHAADGVKQYRRAVVHMEADNAVQVVENYGYFFHLFGVFKG